MHGVKIKGVVLRGKADGPADGLAKGPPTMEPYKKIIKKKLKKIGDQTSKVPLTMYDLIEQGKDDERKDSKANDVHSNQTNPAGQPTKEVIDVAPIQMIVPVIIQGNFSKTNPYKNVVESVSKNVAEISKPSSMVQDVDSKNLTLTLDSVNVCDQPPKEDNIDKTLGEKAVEESPMDVPEINTFHDDILNDKHVETKDSSDEKSQASQGILLKIM